MPYKPSTAPEFYKLRTDPNGTRNLTVTKFDNDLDAISSYIMTHFESTDGGYYDCSCPASKFDCRHKGIMRTIMDANELNSEKFYCFQAPGKPYEKQFVDAKEI